MTIVITAVLKKAAITPGAPDFEGEASSHRNRQASQSHSFDHFVGAAEEQTWDLHPDRARSPEVDHKVSGARSSSVPCSLGRGHSPIPDDPVDRVEMAAGQDEGPTEEMPPNDGRSVCFVQAPDGAQMELIEKV